ncbi:MAG TPA: NAD-dependent epimerase/dehydratase family protein [Blastocatellia bacterium]|nr:NAD-dependent epimerase/dehydratase family protein [Blastocatellia bacterium]
MDLLILGGTIFVGRHLIEAAIARGHQVTMFNRGRTATDLFPGVERLHGDRETDLSALEGRRWDAVIDTCGYLPASVRASARLLADAVDHYAFVSTVAVYADFSKVGIVESDTLAQLPPDVKPEKTELTAETYGPLKVLCEKAVEEFLPGRCLIARAGLIVGPHDPTDRFTYWVRRAARGGRMLAPGKPDRQVQFIDARDLAEWIVIMVESQRAGVFTCTGPDYRLTMGRMLEECKTAMRSDADLVWVADEFLIEEKVGPWNDLPLWLPENNPQYAGFMSVSVNNAVRAGLKFRPPGETIRDTLEWDSRRTEPPQPYKVHGITIPPGGISSEREQELLRRWDRRQ